MPISQAHACVVCHQRAQSKKQLEQSHEKRALDETEQLLNNALALALNSKSSKCVQAVLDATTSGKVRARGRGVLAAMRHCYGAVRQRILAPARLHACHMHMRVSGARALPQVSNGSYHAITDMMPSLAVRYPYMCYRFLAELDLKLLGGWPGPAHAWRGCSPVMRAAALLQPAALAPVAWALGVLVATGGAASCAQTLARAAACPAGHLEVPVSILKSHDESVLRTAPIFSNIKSLWRSYLHLSNKVRVCATSGALGAHSCALHFVMCLGV